MNRLLLRKRRQGRLLFSVLQGNARVMVFTEAIAAIAFQWYVTYLPLYMLALGVSEVQLGVLTSVLILAQFVSTLLGGYMADRFGRKRVLVVFDILCWGIPMFLYAAAQDLWHFVVGRLINGFVYVVGPSFECLFVEDVPVERRPAVFSVWQLFMAGASLLTPVAGYLVAQLGIVTGGRVIMIACMVSLVGMAVVRQFTLKETSVGQARMAATASRSWRLLAPEYAQAVRAMFARRVVRTFLLVRVLEAFAVTMWTTYATVYLTDPRGIGMSRPAVAFLPFVSSIATIGLILLVADRMRAERTVANLLAGQVLWLVAALCFVVSPAGTAGFAVLWTVVSAVSAVLFRPATQSYWAGIVDDQERAQVFSVSAALMTLCTLPAGPLAGALYTRAPQSPFLLGMFVQVLVLGLLLTLRAEPSSP